MESWLHRQFLSNLAQFEKSMENTYPESKQYTKDAESFLNRITVECNYLEAVKRVEWDKYLQSNSNTVVDLAGGIGWLSAYLSKFDWVKKVYILDSSKFFLEKMVPKIADLMGAEKEKINPVEALFSPLHFEDESIDIVVISSSMHHADNIESVFEEIHRILKKNGTLFVLNETPQKAHTYLKRIIGNSVRIIRNTLMKKYMPISPSISSSGILYDPCLGDKEYSYWQWKQAILNAGFQTCQVMNTQLPSVVNTSGSPLVHFICTKQ